MSNIGNTLFTAASNQIASNMLRKAALTPHGKGNEDADRDFVLNNPSAKFSGTTVAVIGTGFQIGAPAKSVAKNAPLAEWIVEFILPRMSDSTKRELVNNLLTRHSQALTSEAAGVPVVTGGSEQIKKVYAAATKEIDGSSTVLDPIGSTPKAPNSSVIGDAATVFIAEGEAHMGGEMTDAAFAALEAAYKAAAAARGVPVAEPKATKSRKPKVKSATTVVAGSGVSTVG
jgi:hypothetical protein